MSKTIQISDVKKDFYVRTQLDTARVDFFVGLYKNGAKVPPIKINEENILIDGRHRIEARVVLGLKDIEVEVVPISNKAKLISEAFRSNVGGPKPPTQQDMEHTVELLLDLGENRDAIARHMRLPAGMVRTLVKDVQSRVVRKKLQQAASSVTEGGLTVAKAAEAHNVRVDRLKEFMSPRRKGKGTVSDKNRQITKMYKSVTLKNSKLCKRVIEQFEDGDITEKDARDILGHLRMLANRSSRNVFDWVSRFNALTKSDEAVTSAESEVKE